MTNVQIAQTIINQLGGRRFMVFTGARDVTAIQSGVRFKLPRLFEGQKVYTFEVRLMPSDTYTIRTYSVRGKEIDVVSDVYCESLVDVFETTTGFLTHA